MNRDHAKKYSLDVSHVIAVELPLIVKNVDKAIAMLGGQERIRRAVSSQYQPLPIQASSHSLDDRNLELRLRNDPFQHPVQALLNRREKILLKVSIPKSSLPKDYYDNPNKYSIRELVARNREKDYLQHSVEPVAIINKNFSFRGMADFQMSTKNNERAQKYNKGMLTSKKFSDLKEYSETELVVADELTNPETFANKDHHLIPPPCFSGIRFPFDYKYQKNPFTVTLRDENGDSKVVMKFDQKKLFTNTVDYNAHAIPQKPLPEIISKYEWLKTADLVQDHADKKLYECIQFIAKLFDLKPIWLRRLIVNVVPEHLKSAVKEALPYVSYCFKNGPWRFCNVRLGLDPKTNKSNWIHQSENFRVLGLKAIVHPRDQDARIVPPTIQKLNRDCDIKLSESLFFTGTKLPKTVNYQIGDIMDLDLEMCINNAISSNQFFRDEVDPQDGWIQKQVIETVRRIVKYKLRQLKDEEMIDPAKLHKIVQTDYTLKDSARAHSTTDGQRFDAIDDEEQQDDQDADEDELDDEEDDMKQNLEDMEVNDKATGLETEANVFTRMKQVDKQTAAKLKEFVGYIKQDAVKNCQSEN